MDKDKIIIFLRRTQDWRKVHTVSIQKPFDNTGIRKGIKEWGETYKISYWEYRHRIKEIAMRSWEDFSSNIVVGQGYKIVKEIKDDQFVVPTDDDDWFSPHLRDALLKSNAEFVWWIPLLHRTFIYHALHYWRKDNLCSNSYAVRGSLLKKLNNAKKGVQLLHCHGIALNKFREVTDSIETIQNGSLYNWHGGSASALSKMRDYGTNINQIFPKQLRNYSGIQDRNPWIIPYFKDFCETIKVVQGKTIKMH